MHFYPFLTCKFYVVTFPSSRTRPLRDSHQVVVRDFSPGASTRLRGGRACVLFPRLLLRATRTWETALGLRSPRGPGQPVHVPREAGGATGLRPGPLSADAPGSSASPGPSASPASPGFLPRPSGGCVLSASAPSPRRGGPGPGRADWTLRPGPLRDVVPEVPPPTPLTPPRRDAGRSAETPAEASAAGDLHCGPSRGLTGQAEPADDGWGAAGAGESRTAIRVGEYLTEADTDGAGGRRVGIGAGSNFSGQGCEPGRGRCRPRAVSGN